MTNDTMGKGYIKQAEGWHANLARMLKGRQWANVVRQAQECVELLLKGALRLVCVEPTRTHDVSDVLKSSATRFPVWFARHIPELAELSRQLAKDRGPSFYGDELAGIPPCDLFDESRARWAYEGATKALKLCKRLRRELGHGNDDKK